MRTVNPNAVTAIIRLVAVIAVVVALLQFCACSPQRKTNKAVQRVLANREALNRVGAEWQKLNPCANEYKPGQWIELTDSAKVNVSLPPGAAFGGPWPNAVTTPGIIDLFDSLGTVPAPVPEQVGVWEPVFTLSQDKRSIVYDGRTYWWPQRRFVRIDTVKDNRALDSARAEVQRQQLAVSRLQGQYDEAKQSVQVQAARGDRWFRWFIVSVVVGIVLLIVSHLIRSRFKIWP